MATLTNVAGTASTTGGNTAASGSFTPVAGDLLVVFVAATGSITVATMISSISGVTFTRITSVLKNTSADTITIFVSNAFVPASAQTVTAGNLGAGCTGAVILIYRVAGMTRTGPDAIRQFSSQANGAAAGTPAPVFNVAALTGNPCVGCVGNSTNPATMTPTASWTEGSDLGYATPTAGAENQGIASGFTGTTVTWGSTSASAFGALIAELNTAISVVGIQDQIGGDQPRIDKYQILSY